MKTVEREMARKLRREWLSMRQIERSLGVARSTVSLWVREIELTDHQREELQARGASARG
jgi:IS30 family transposase